MAHIFDNDDIMLQLCQIINNIPYANVTNISEFESLVESVQRSVEGI